MQTQGQEVVSVQCLSNAEGFMRTALCVRAGKVVKPHGKLIRHSKCSVCVQVMVSKIFTLIE